MLPPTIPTSFVPRAPRAGAQGPGSGFVGAFGFIAYGVLGIVFILAIGVFLYGRTLSSTQASMDTELADAVKGIDSATVEGFVRLRDRLSEGQKLLNEHVAFTGFFSSLEKTLPISVRFSTIRLSLEKGGAPMLEGSGVAKDFNALASVSAAFAEDGRIKSAIFSNITINTDGSVSFKLSALLDPKLVAFSP